MRSWMLAVVCIALAPGAWAQDQCTPTGLSDGRHVLKATWPVNTGDGMLAMEVCFFRPGVADSDLCRSDPIETTEGGTQFSFGGETFAINTACGSSQEITPSHVAALAVQLDPSIEWTWQAYAKNSAGRGPNSAQVMFIPAAVAPDPGLPVAPVLLGALQTLAREEARLARRHARVLTRFADAIAARGP